MVRQSELPDRTTDAIHILKPLCNVSKLKFFLSLCNVYRRCVPNSTRLAAPFNWKLKKDQRRTFDTLMPEEHDASSKTKENLVSAIAWALSRSKGHLALDTIASHNQNRLCLEAITTRLDKTSTQSWVESVYLIRTELQNHISRVFGSS